MRSEAQTVDEYMDGLIPGRRGPLEQVRALCLAHLSGFEEGLKYRMPTYVADGEAVFAFASQKQYISLYVMDKAIFARFKRRMPKADCGKCCLRFRKTEDLDFDALEDLLTHLGAT